MFGDGAEDPRDTPLEVAEVGESDCCSASAGSSSESDSSSHSPFDLSFLFSADIVERPPVDRLVMYGYPEIASRKALNVYGRSENIVTLSKIGRTIVRKSRTGFGLRFWTAQAYRT
jgi:hypothetical protein